MAGSGEVVTYRQLDERSNQGAHLFRSLGLKTGDVLVRVADKAVSTPQDVVAAVDGAKASGRESVLLLVYRDGRTLFVLVKMAK